jgi:uncharacterized protein YneF (UPF0154 family)
MSPIIIDLWLFVGLLSMCFLAGAIAGIKAARIRIILDLIKKIPPKDFEKLLEGYNKS